MILPGLQDLSDNADARESQRRTSLDPANIGRPDLGAGEVLGHVLSSKHGADSKKCREISGTAANANCELKNN